MNMEKKLKILLVDDDELIRTLYADVFKMENFDVVGPSMGWKVSIRRWQKSRI